MALAWFKLRSGIVPSAEKVLNRKENPKETGRQEPVRKF